MKNSAEVMRHLTHAPWTNPAFGKNVWLKHQNDLTGDLPGKAPLAATFTSTLSKQLLYSFFDISFAAKLYFLDVRRLTSTTS